MRRIGRVFTISLLGLALLPGTGRSEEQASDRLQYPLAPGNIAFRGGTVRFKAEWSGPQGTMFNPRAVTSALAVSTDAERKTISLDPGKWKELKKQRGFRYADKKGQVRSILVRLRKSGGLLKIGAAVGATQPSSAIGVALTIGSARWCAEFNAPFKRKGRNVVAVSKTGPASCPCAEPTASTWEVIQKTIIDRYGCTNAACHGGVPGENNGYLDLSPDVAYANLVGVPSTRIPGLERVKRADRTHSLLWLKLAMKASPDEFADIAARLGIASTAGSAMPLNEFKLTPDELEAVRLWIQNGAPETGVVNGTAGLLSACLPPPDPIKIQRPAVPAAADGVQFHAPPWDIPPRAEGQNGEDEVCYVTYYDFSDHIPPDMKLSKDDPLCAYWGGDRDCFYFNRSALTQDPNSHHSIIHIYKGAYAPGSPEWVNGFGPFNCRDGDRAGQACDPLGSADQCPGGTCTGRIESGVACIGYGPPDYGFSVVGGTGNAPSIGGSQQPYSELNEPPGIFGLYPVKGTIVWNSHAFNVTDRPTTNEQYLNVWFAKTAADRQDLIRGIFDAGNIFVQNVPPFERREYCATFTLPQGARLSGLSSHTHKRGVLFRIWTPPNTPCVKTNCSPDETRPPLVSTTIYNDPIQYDFDPPMPLDGADAASRTIKYCSVYDNGFRNPNEVKRRSTSPVPPLVLAPGGPCGPFTGLACFNEAHRGEPCGGDDRRCDSAPGANDGVCDACPLRGGVTTEDEMYILLGSWYLPGSLDDIRAGR